MRGGKQLLLFAALILWVKCQQRPDVIIRPDLKNFFNGDLFYLICSNSGSTVKWYLNDVILPETNNTLRKAAASPADSGKYVCESDGAKSNECSITVHEYTPSASLTIETGGPVMPTKGAVRLKIENEDGLKGWMCKVNRGEETKTVKLKLTENSVSFVFQPTELKVPETIYWCTNSTEECRSNQITLWTTDKDVMLEMYPWPAVAGESLTLRCIVWGSDQVRKSVFLRNDTEISTVTGSTHTITIVDMSDMGRYKCHATYRYSAQTRKLPHQKDSDTQYLSVQVPPVRATLSKDMLCSCSSCGNDMPYRYYKKNGQSWTMLPKDQKPDRSGTYRCRAVGEFMRTLPSASVDYSAGVPLVGSLIGILVIVLLVGGAFVVYFAMKNRRNSQVYEDVGLQLRGEQNYEELQKVRGRGGEYDTLHPEASGTDRKGEYAPLKRAEMQEEEYHDLGAQGATGGDGGYEALQKSEMQQGEYHSLGAPGAAGGGGGYEALKKSGMQEGEYQTLDAKKST
ncbi:uncharacterized protein LOC133418930 isoform X2 [Cololabis saira]|uniref:uncharacterized protein LOC133418930 isoform X2 n=1 Tax=Cololabis saira TaxID=129043 RepID=UPI002AD32BE4|nr:uncharacterized protein LOC133418930 isoform X2 [Cololabis saira]